MPGASELYQYPKNYRMAQVQNTMHYKAEFSQRQSLSCTCRGDSCKSLCKGFLTSPQAFGC